MKKMGGTRRWQMSVLGKRRDEAVRQKDIEDIPALLPRMEVDMMESDDGSIKEARNAGERNYGVGAVGLVHSCNCLVEPLGRGKVRWKPPRASGHDVTLLAGTPLAQHAEEWKTGTIQSGRQQLKEEKA
jgi:hypothetical protein